MSSNTSSNTPQALKLTDFLRPVFQESNLIREYCLFAQIQQQSQGPDNQTSISASQETLNSGGTVKMLTGLYVIPSAASHYVWFGLLCINNERSNVPSPFDGGVFRFYIRFPENYPTGLPSITFLPTTLQSHPLTQSQQQYTTLNTHPDINPQTGQFNLRAFISPSSLSSSPQVPRIYKILRILRKSFYRQFNDIEVQNCLNPSAAEMSSRDYEEFLRNCAIDASESLKYLRETDNFVVQKFKGDGNLILLGVERGAGAGGGSENGVKKEGRRKAVGLSFM